MAKSNTIEFKGHFDGKQVLDELKKIRQSMSDAGADSELFKNVDKDIASTEKLISDMMAQINKGFSNTKEVSNFEKQFEKLQTSFSKITTGLQNVNIAENLGANTPEITKLTQQITRLKAAQDSLRDSSKQAVEAAGRTVSINQDEVNEIKKAIDANEDLEEVLKRVGQAKEKAAKAQAGQSGLATQKGQDLISSASAGLSLDELGAKATSGKTAKGKDDARARRADGTLKGSADSRQLDIAKADVAVTESYQKALEETIKSGGSAADAVEEMKKALADYGIEISNVEKLQENFANSLTDFYSSDAINRGQKSAVTKATQMGSTNAAGEYELSDAARQAFLNNEDVTAYADNIREITEATEQLGAAQEEANAQAEATQQRTTDSINSSTEAQKKNEEATREGIEATEEATEAQEKMDGAFDNIKDSIKTFFSLGNAISGLRDVLQSTFEDIQRLDEAFASIAMVTEYSVADMWGSYDQYAQMANELGQSTESVIQASALFYQQG